MQEPPVPEDPAEELAEPNFFTDAKLLPQELHAMGELNATAAEQLQVRRPVVMIILSVGHDHIVCGTS